MTTVTRIDDGATRPIMRVDFHFILADWAIDDLLENFRIDRLWHDFWSAIGDSATPRDFREDWCFDQNPTTVQAIARLSSIDSRLYEFMVATRAVHSAGKIQ